MKKMMVLFFLLFQAESYANGAAAYIVLQNSQSRASEQVNDGVKADGYVVVREFYFDGPLIRICSGDNQHNLVVHQNLCAIKETRRLPFFSLSWSGVEHSFKSVGAGITTQEYLDKKFGAGAVTFAGISPRNSVDGASLFVFYTINSPRN